MESQLFGFRLRARRDVDAIRKASVATGTLDAIDRSQALIEFDPQGAILSANKNFLELMGYETSEVIGRHHRMFVVPEDAKSEAYETFWHSLRAGAFVVADFRRVAKGGREVWIQGSYNPVLSSDGRCERIVKIATDVTAAKQQAVDFAGQIAAIGKSQAVIAFALDGTILEANDALLAVMGYERAEVIGRHHRMFVDEGEADGADYRAFWERLRAGAHSSGEFKRFAKGGREVWLQASYNPIVGLDGRPVKVVKYAADVTAAKTKASNFAGQISAIGRSQAVIEFDLNGTILDANENFLKTMGYDIEEIVGQKHAMFVPAHLRSSRDYAEFWQQLRAGQFFSREFPRIGKGGRTVWIQASYNPIFDLNGQPFKVVKYATDITVQVQERKKFNLLSLVADETDNSVVITDQDQKIIYVNHGFERLTGFEASEVMGRTPGPLLQGPKTDRATVARIRSRLAAGESFYDEILNYSKTSQPYWISLAINPIRGRSGKIERYISIQANITETKQRSLEFTDKLSAIGTANIIAEWTLDGAPLTVNRSLSRAFDIGLDSMVDDEALAGIIGGKALRQEVKWVVAGQEPLWLDAFFTVLNDLEGKPQRILMCGVDVTSRRSATDQSSKAMSDMMERITGIVEAISGFARETNLLALNAGIEAARAQDTGRGFAIIAQEIRKLAGKAGCSVDEINALLTKGNQEIERLAHEKVPELIGVAPVVDKPRASDQSTQAVIRIVKGQAA